MLVRAAQQVEPNKGMVLTLPGFAQTLHETPGPCLYVRMTAALFAQS